MGSKKHKKHKSERREKYEDRQFCLERPPSLKLILKVGGGGNSSTPEHGSGDSPASYGVHHNSSMHHHHHHQHGGDSADFSGEYSGEKHKKSKKKKKKKDREKRHKHQKEKRRNDSSQEDMSIGEDSQQQQQLQESIERYADVSILNSPSSQPVTKPMHPLKSPSPEKVMLEEFTPIADSPPPTHSSPLPDHNSPSVHKASGGAAAATSSTDYLKSPASDSSGAGREPRSCVLKQKQSKSPLSKLLDHLLRALEKKDPHQFFAWPVTDDIAPGYSSIISDPMDFLSIRQKVDENEYSTLQEFSDDFRLMCENAIKYNHAETVYHKAAKRLLHIGAKMLQPDQLMRSLRPLMVYMRELTPRELGFDLALQSEQPQSHGDDSHILDSADEGMSTGAEEAQSAQHEEDEKRKSIRRANNPLTRFEAYVDDLTAEEVLEQVQVAAKAVRKRVMGRKNANKMGFLRQNKDGTTSMKMMLANSNDCPERIVSIGAFTGKLQQGTGQLQGFREDRRNAAKVVKPINYGAFCSFAPTYDSRFSNLNKEESELVLNTYGNDASTEYAGSIMEFSRDSSYASTLANGLLDILTYGEHRKTLATLVENQRQRAEQHEIDQSFPNSNAKDSTAAAAAAAAELAKYENVAVDFDTLRTLGDIGVDISFLSSMEQSMRSVELTKKLQEQLMNNSTLIERLQQVQTERLSQTLPQHLAHVARPSSDEIELAHQLTSNLTEMAKQLPPDSIAQPHALRKVMGISNVGLEPFSNGSRVLSVGATSDVAAPIAQKIEQIGTTPVPMDLEPESSSSGQRHLPVVPVSQATAAAGSSVATAVITATGAGAVSQVDIENELREFLESGAGTPTADDTIEQMLLD